MIYGYARCSTNEKRQDIDRQVMILCGAGVPRDNIVLEYAHRDAPKKDKLEALFARMVKGDALITSEVTRLVGSMRQLCDIIDIVKDKSIRLQIVGGLTVDCSTGKLDPISEAVFQISGVFAQLEIDILRERVKEGVRNARAKGKKIGRPTLTEERIPDAFYRYLPRYQNGELNKKELALLCGVSRPTIYNWLLLVGEKG